MSEPKATVVSILPYEIFDSKPNLYPGSFIIPAGTIMKPGLLTVGKSAFYIPMAFGAASLQAFSSAFEVATSIVVDYVGALLSVDEDARPGIFVANECFEDVKTAAVKLAVPIAKYQALQRNWYIKLVNMADAEYRSHGNANAISDLQKVAARELNLKDKPWLLDIGQLALNNCPVCYSPVNALAAVCGSCRHVINMERYKAINATKIPEVSLVQEVSK